MLKTLAVANYRSINNLVMPLGRLNLITGANGSGKSNLYRALRLLAETAQGGVVNALAKEGGLESTFWAGPEQISRRMSQGEVPVQGGPRKAARRLQLGFAGEDFGYAISLGLPDSSGHFMLPGHSLPIASRFTLDPWIKRESIWGGPLYRSASALVDRQGPMVRARAGRQWEVLAQHTSSGDSLFDRVGNLSSSPEVLHLREQIRGWRFYDHLRTDSQAPARRPQLGTRTRCCTTMAGTWPPRCRPLSRWAISRHCTRASATPSRIRGCRSMPFRGACSACSCTRKACCDRCRRRNCRTAPCATCCW